MNIKERIIQAISTKQEERRKEEADRKEAIRVAIEAKDNLVRELKPVTDKLSEAINELHESDEFTKIFGEISDVHIVHSNRDIKSLLEGIPVHGCVVITNKRESVWKDNSFILDIGKDEDGNPSCNLSILKFECGGGEDCLGTSFVQVGETIELVGAGPEMLAEMVQDQLIEYTAENFVPNIP